jgi:hypothetical protein
MSERYECLSCGGQYSPVQADGTFYYHACAPIGRDAEGRAIERPDKRDENLARDATPEAPRMKAEGRGRAPYVRPPPPPPPPPQTLLARVRDFVMGRKAGEEG